MKLSSIGYLTKEGLHNIWNNRMMSLASVVVLVSCLIITAAAALMSVNVSTLIGQLGDDNEMTVYLLPEYRIWIPLSWESGWEKFRMSKAIAILPVIRCWNNTKNNWEKKFIRVFRMAGILSAMNSV